MLDPMKSAHIERLLQQGDLSQRQIARLAGVGRSSVAATAQGQRGDAGEPESRPSRCPGCGGLVLLPCRLCFVRSWLQRSRQRAVGSRQKGEARLET
jgi:hypothetical protein